MQKQIFNILNKVGVPCNLLGRLYIEAAINIVDEKGIVSITKELYPEIAKSFNTTSSRVERAIRHAIKLVFSNTDFDELYEVFGNVINSDSEKITNSEFIYGIVKYLEINCAEE